MTIKTMADSLSEAQSAAGVERLTVNAYEEGLLTIDQSPEGEFVSYSDYAEVSARLDACREVLTFIKAEHEAKKEELSECRERLAAAEVNEARYLFLRDSAENQSGHPFIARRNAFGISAWNDIHADKAIDSAIDAIRERGGKP